MAIKLITLYGKEIADKTLTLVSDRGTEGNYVNLLRLSDDEFRGAIIKTKAYQIQLNAVRRIMGLYGLEARTMIINRELFNFRDRAREGNMDSNPNHVLTPVELDIISDAHGTILPHVAAGHKNTTTETLIRQLEYLFDPSASRLASINLIRRCNPGYETDYPQILNPESLELASEALKRTRFSDTLRSY